MINPKVLFVCTENSCRSQMAEGFLRRHAGDRFELFSGGAQHTRLNPMAVEVMKETGVDISGQCAKDVAQFLGQPFQFVIRVCDKVKEKCPVLPGAASRRVDAPSRNLLKRGHPLRVLILCTGNSARSQMAEGLLRHESGGTFEVVSAGTHPSHVRSEAIAVMQELGIDISGHRSKSVEEFAGRHFDFVITVCDNARESCPVFPDTTKRIHWSIEDPAAVQGSKDARLNAFRQARDVLRERLRRFASQQT